MKDMKYLKAKIFLNKVSVLLFLLALSTPMGQCKKSVPQGDIKGVDLDLMSETNLIAKFDNLLVDNCHFMIQLESVKVNKIALPTQMYNLFVSGDPTLANIGKCSESINDSSKNCVIASSSTNDLSDWFPSVMHAKVINLDFARSECKSVMSDYSFNLATAGVRSDKDMTPVKVATVMMYQKGLAKTTIRDARASDTNYRVFYGDTFPIVLKLTLDQNNKLVIDNLETRTDTETAANSNDGIIPTAINIAGADFSRCSPLLDDSQAPINDEQGNPIQDCSKAIQTNEGMFSLKNTEQQPYPNVREAESGLTF